MIVCTIFAIIFFRKNVKRRVLYQPHRNALGFKIIDEQNMAGGYNLYDGQLIDERGKIIKQWPHYYLGILDENGDYYGGQVYKKQWGRYRWNGHAVWEKYFPIHHDLHLSPHGTVFVLTTEARRYLGCPMNFDIIIEFDKDGNELQRYSFWDHRRDFQRYRPLRKKLIDILYNPILALGKSIAKSKYSYFHLNSFFIVPQNALSETNPAFRAGNWLISLKHEGMVFILDSKTKKIVWHAVGNDVEGGLEGQHAVSMRPDGMILLFENGIKRRASRVLLIDPLNRKIVWQYRDKNFFSEHGGFAQTLPNGNYLIVESEKNHVFEITQDKKILWEYYAPPFSDHSLYRMTRYPKEMVEQFLQKRS